MINISEKKSETDCCYFLIENKIKKSAFKENQCLEQFLLFKQIENFKDDIPIFSILISPDNKNFKTMIDNVKEENLYSIWLKWQSDNSDSIIDIFKQLIKLENNSEIPPIDINTQFIIKSFIDYVSTELSVGKTTNFSVAGSQIIEQAEFEIKNKRYLLKRFDNKMIRIYNQDNEMINEPVKPILREIIQSYKLDVNLYGKSGKLKNTQILGRDVIRALNNKLE